MPVFTIETPSGKTLDIEAADESAALRGAQEWSKQQNASGVEKTADEVEKVPGALAHGLSGVAKGFGATAKALGGSGAALNDFGDAVAHPGYEPATERFLNPQPGDTTVAGYGVGSLPRAAAETLPGLATDVSAARLGKALGWRGALAGGLLSFAGRTFGNEAQETADKRTGKTGADITGSDKLTAAGSTAAQAALNQLAVSRLLKRGGKAGTSASAELGKKTGLEAVTETGQDAISQAATSAASAEGPQVDLHRAVGSGVIGGATGGAFAAPRAAVDASNARRFSDIDQESGARVSSRIQQRAGTDNLQKGSTAFESVRAAETDIFTDLTAALDTDPELKQAIEQNPEARRAFEHVKRRETVTDSDLANIANAVAGRTNALVVSDLVQDARTVSRLKQKGTYDEPAGKFTGGTSTPIEAQVRLLKSPTGALAASGLAGAGIYSGLGIYTPAALAAVGGGWLTARALDKFTGRRSPAKTFVERFAKDGTKTRNPIAPAPTPADEPVDLAKEATDLMSARRANEALARRQAKANAPAPEPDFSEQIKDATDRMAARKANMGITEELLAKLAARSNEEAQADAFTKHLDKFKLYREDMKDAEEQMKARKANTTLRGEAQAEAVGRSSPFLDQSGGFDLLNAPGVGPKLSKLASAASAFNKLQRDPAADAAEEAATAEEARVVKETARVEKATKEAAKAAERAERERAKAEKAEASANAKAAKAAALQQRVMEKQAKREAKIAKAPAPQVQPEPVASPAPAPAPAPAPVTDDGLDLPDALKRYVEAPKPAAVKPAPKSDEDDGLDIPDFLDRRADKPKLPQAAKLPPAAKAAKVAAAHTRKDDTKKSKPGDEFTPPSIDYWHMEPSEAADVIVKRHIDGGMNIQKPAAYRASIVRRLTGQHEALERIGKGLKRAEQEKLQPYFEHLWASDDTVQARKTIDSLKRALPEHAARIDEVFSDDTIKRLWTPKRQQ
jgi:hypothetical protein